jgi:Doubled CXXCH motif (Paired_CXXCH_1)/Cytochrome c554 and c-prime
MRSPISNRPPLFRPIRISDEIVLVQCKTITNTISAKEATLKQRSGSGLAIATLHNTLGYAACLAISLLLCSIVFAQRAVTAVEEHSRQGTILDEISDPSERVAFAALSEKTDPNTLHDRAVSFIKTYPTSAFLPQAFDIAARSSFDIGDFSGGLDDAFRSLSLWPEQPLLLTAVADVQASQLQDDSAIQAANEALTYFERFGHPIVMTDNDWQRLKAREQAIDYFVIGRSDLHKGSLQTSPTLRKTLIEEAVASLKEARLFNSSDRETIYVLGLAYVASDDRSDALIQFLSLDDVKDIYASKSRAELEILSRARFAHPDDTSHSSDAVTIATTSHKDNALDSGTTSAPADSSHISLSEYAGSAACSTCHEEIYRDWSETGMARMLRPYQAKNVLGDFSKNNEFYIGDTTEYLHGRLISKRQGARQLFARMEVRGGHYIFDLVDSSGVWHSYPVDYTIGSKWQQAYATKLPNGEIHVFPLEYNIRLRRWLEYWESIDAPGSERSDPYNFFRLDDSTNYQKVCAPCHTSQLRVINPGNATSRIEFREPGINCEMCHGPSAEHVSSMNDDDEWDPNSGLDPPVDFNRISNLQYVQICAQCHMQSALRPEGNNGELNYPGSASFPPRYLSISFDAFSRKAFYKDGRFAESTFIVEALERSKCFTKGNVSCGYCHDPHGHDFASNPTSLRFKDNPNLMCTGCHAQFADAVNLVAHSHHGVNSKGSECITCHMPSIMDALAFEARSHKIDDIPNAEMTIRFGQSDSPNACLICHSDKTPGWVEKQLVTFKQPSQNLASR